MTSRRARVCANTGGVLVALALAAFSSRAHQADPPAPTRPTVILGAQPAAQVVADALSGQTPPATVASEALTQSTLADPDVVLLAADAAHCAMLSRARTPRRACTGVRRDDVPAGVSAVVADAQSEVAMQLVARAFPGRGRVLLLRDPASAAFDDELKAAATRAGLVLVLVDVRSPGEAVPAFLSAMRLPGPPAVWLAVPDRSVFTADTLAPIAQAALAARVPLIGFAPFFLRIGALAAIETDRAEAARAAWALAQAHGATPPATVSVRSSPRARLIVDGRLASRLGVNVGRGADVEVRQ